ncbi:hypothetical protein RFI_15087 [Reticulomyxa filosa]|uniref:Uncharacterized protein n=1 Tax=Reticulomyxa filosa TaxID=46433 RepID=X6N9Y6_RETFI|nr:hypothetical protein RFI_15087 [Reticulomyxa filosa]|eukprot:ETO22117.1 hypothetical protein RFI_15087 [Reticulomyxa filosa]
MSFKAYVYDGSKMHRITLTERTMKHLKHQINQATQQSRTDELAVITDAKGCSVESDENVIASFEGDSAFFNVHFRPSFFFLLSLYFQVQKLLKKESTPKITETTIHELKYPLVLLTGAMQYEQRPYLEEAKQDVILLQTLFEKKLGYKVITTFTPQNVDTESLTLNDLKSFIAKQCSILKGNVSDDKDNYDGLIFVWCGYGGFENNGDTLITSDNKGKDFKDVEDDFALRTKYFIGKPKIFIKVAYGGQGISRPIATRQYDLNPDVFTVLANSLEKPMIENRIQQRKYYFVEIFCQVLQSSWDQSFQSLMEQVTKVVRGQTLEREVVQTISTLCTDLYLISDPLIDKLVMMTKQNVKLNPWTYWNRDWKQANVEAAKIVEQMIRDNEQGLVVVARNMDAWQNQTNCNACSFYALANTDKVEKQQFGEYWMCVIKSKLIVLDGANIAGNVYAVNCEMQCREKVVIAMQLFVSKNVIMDQNLISCIAPIQWDARIHDDIPFQLQTLRDNAEQCLTKNQFDDAVVLFQQALQISVNTFNNSHPYIADFRHSLGLAYYCKKQHDKAIEQYERSLKIRLRIFGSDHPGIAQLYHNLGLAFGEKKVYDKAIEYYQMSLKIRLLIISIKQFAIANAYSNLRFPYEDKRHYEKSNNYYEMSLKIQLDVFRVDRADVAWSYNNLGSIYADKGKYDKAIEYFEKALGIRLDIFGPNHIHVAASYSNLGSVYYYKQQYDRAIEYFEKSLDIKLQIFGSNHVHTANSYKNLGLIHKNKGQYDKAIEYYEKTLIIMKDIFGSVNRDIGDSNCDLGYAFEKKAEYKTAYKHYEAAWKVYSTVLGEWHNFTLAAKKKVEQLNKRIV